MAVKPGMTTPYKWNALLSTLPTQTRILTVIDRPVRVVRVVVVEGAGRGAITHVVAIRGIRRTQKPIPGGYSCQPISDVLIPFLV